jgi:hypothetical protein
MTDLPTHVLALTFQNLLSWSGTAAKTYVPTTVLQWNHTVSQSEVPSLGRKIDRTLLAVDQNMMQAWTESKLQVTHQTYKAMK